MPSGALDAAPVTGQARIACLQSGGYPARRTRDSRITERDGYGDMQLGLTDASIAMQAARHKTTRILSLDRKHFAVVRPLTGEAGFTLLPCDDQA